MRITNNIKVLRAQKNLTQESLAKKVGVSRQTIIAIEKEKYLPSLSLAFKISLIFNLSIGEVFTLKNEKN